MQQCFDTVFNGSTVLNSESEKDIFSLNKSTVLLRNAKRTANFIKVTVQRLNIEGYCYRLPNKFSRKRFFQGQLKVFH